MLEYNSCRIPAFFDVGCGIPGDCYSQFMREFEKLDKTDPYDNQFTFANVTEVEFEKSRKRTAIQMRFISRQHGEPYRIIGLVAVENKNGAFELCKGWNSTKQTETVSDSLSE